MEQFDLATALGSMFVERRDVKAWQYPDGAYRPERERMILGDLKRHVAGDRTLGHYLVSPEGKVRVIAFDIDLKKARKEGADEQRRLLGCEEVDPRAIWAQADHPDRGVLAVQLSTTAWAIARRAHALTDLHVAAATSGSKGLHVYVFTGTIEASAARSIGREILVSLGLEPTRGDNFFAFPDEHMLVDVELFPKQDSVDGGGLGNLMKLPCGIHRKTSERTHFIRFDGRFNEFTEMPAEDALGARILPWEAHPLMKLA